jgi:hypothetical protein
MASTIESPAGPPKQPTPNELARALERIVAEETGCTASWVQHPQTVRPEELQRIAPRICALLWEVRGRL